MYDTLGFICGAYMGSLNQAGPEAVERVGKTNSYLIPELP
jgi:hypothetical protein